MIDDDNGLIMYKEWKKVFTLVNIEPFKFGDSYPKERLRKTWSEVMRNALKERILGKDLTKVRNT